MDQGNYWDIDDFLVEEEPIRITIDRDVLPVGIIDSETETLESGTKVTYPLWLANILCTRSFATVEIPPYFSESYK